MRDLRYALLICWVMTMVAMPAAAQCPLASRVELKSNDYFSVADPSKIVFASGVHFAVKMTEEGHGVLEYVTASATGELLAAKKLECGCVDHLGTCQIQVNGDVADCVGSCGRGEGCWWYFVPDDRVDPPILDGQR